MTAGNKTTNSLQAILITRPEAHGHSWNIFSIHKSQIIPNNLKKYKWDWLRSVFVMPAMAYIPVDFEMSSSPEPHVIRN